MHTKYRVIHGIFFSISSSHFPCGYQKLSGLAQDKEVQRVSCEQTEGLPIDIKCGEVLECLRSCFSRGLCYMEL